MLLESLAGAAAHRVVPALARLRIAVFREWPYLYDGSIAYEEGYLQTYARSPSAVIVTARDGEAVVGAATGLPLADASAEVRAALDGKLPDPVRTFYFGESVLLPDYRGRGLGAGFFRHREGWARAQGFKAACFCAVARPDNHPARPPGHVPLDAFWRKRGYRPLPGATATFTWRDLGEAEAAPKPLHFWIREF